MRMVQEQVTDEELLQQARAAEPEVRRRLVGTVFGRHQRRVALWCLRFTGERESAADLAQEVFLKAFAGLADFHGEARFSTWLYSITRHHCLNYLQRAEHRRRQQQDELTEELAEEPSADVLGKLEKKSELELARRLMNEHLNDLEKKVLTMRYVQGLPMDAVTRLLGLQNSSGAKAHVVSAKRKLKRALDRARAGRPRSGREVQP